MKKLFSLLLASALALSLGACGGSTTSESTGSAATSEAATSEAATSEAAESTPAEGEASGDLITVGFAQVGHESDWRTASTQSAQDVFSEENGYQLSIIN